ncbi:hypothetical protein AQUCO_00400082v1 [Aquilegia coerulea]|uniref:Uncharacterized protein n=1 Tax=Aquilegia coerulea TaxID=218851 RepID=A0A2G5ET95_AQUCA|nr:hypothetical protein AQUCO_00400082v1 [Aquilegia coerulea]
MKVIAKSIKVLKENSQYHVTNPISGIINHSRLCQFKFHCVSQSIMSLSLLNSTLKDTKMRSPRCCLARLHISLHRFLHTTITYHCTSLLHGFAPLSDFLLHNERRKRN